MASGKEGEGVRWGERSREGKKKDHSLAINGRLTLSAKWIRVYGRSTTPLVARADGDWGLGGLGTLMGTDGVSR